MGFRIPHFQHFPPFVSIIFLSFLIFQHPPCPRRVPYRQVEPVTQGISPRWVHGSPLFRVARVQPLGTCMAGTVRVASGSVQGCRGRSPRQNKLIVSPFPGGEERSASAGGGMGAKKQTKVRVGRRQERQAPGGTCSLCPGGEDHLKRRRRVRRIVPSPPVPPSPWLPALFIGNRFLPFSRRTVGSALGMQGAEPLA